MTVEFQVKPPMLMWSELRSVFRNSVDSRLTFGDATRRYRNSRHLRESAWKHWHI